MRAATLEQANLELEASLSPRIFRDQAGAKEALAQFVPVTARVEYVPDEECKRTAEQIVVTLHWAGWNFVHGGEKNPKESVFFDDVTVNAWAAGPVSADVTRAADAATALISELNRVGIAASPGGAAIDELPKGIVLIKVGLRPNPAQRRLRTGVGGNTLEVP
jgi:hypothetical protein